MQKKIVILVVATLLPLFALEIFVRIALKDKIDSNIIRSKFFNIGAVPSDDPDIVYELQRELIYFDKETTSSVKLAMIGDSTPYGWGPDKKISYPYYVAKKLNMQLRNYSVPGYNTKQELAQFRKYIKDWKPDYIMIHHDGNDADPTARFFPMDASNPDYGNNFLHSGLIKYTIRTLKSMNNRGIDTNVNPTLGWSIISGPLYDEHVLALKTLIKEASETGAKVIVVLYDSEEPNENRKELLRKPLIEKLKNSPCQIISLESVWKHRISETDLHPDPTGQKNIADQIIQKIKK